MIRRMTIASVLGLAAWIAGAHTWVQVAAGPEHVEVATLPVRSVVIVPGALVHPDGTPSWFLARRLDGALGPASVTGGTGAGTSGGAGSQVRD